MNTGEIPRTLYVGNLSHEVTEDLLQQVFGQFGIVKSCKIIREPSQDPYAFIEYNSSNDAQSALSAMNKINMLDKELRVNWAASSQHSNRSGEAKWNSRAENFPIFVGDLSAEIDDQQLKQCFGAFGEIADVKIVRDPHTMKSKGYGFVAYLRKQDAESAIHSMNGQWLGARAIRTNWATRKPVSGGNGVRETQKLNFDEVYAQSSPANMTVYVGNNLQGLSEQYIRDRMEQYGAIVEVRVFKEKGYAFCRFQSKVSAANAICDMNGEDFNGQNIKCAWGKESGDMSNGGMPMGGMQSVSPMMGGGRQNYGQHSQGNMGGMVPVQQQQYMQQQQQQQQQPSQNQQQPQQVAYNAYGSPYQQYAYQQYAAYAANPEWQQQMQQWQQYYNAYSQQQPGAVASSPGAGGWGVAPPGGYPTAAQGAAVGGPAAPQHYE